MRKRRRILLLSAVALLVLAAILLLRALREPSYRGRPLTEWAEMYDDATSIDTRKQAEDAIRHIGTNAWPYLLKSIRYEGHRSLSFKLKNTLAGLFGAPQPSDSNRRRAEAAVVALRVLGPDCEPIVLELVELWRDRAHPKTATRALSALYYIRPGAFPTILAALTNQETAMRLNAAQAIAYIGMRPGGLGTDSQVAATGLIQCLKDKDEDLATSAAWALSTLTNVPDLVSPALAASLQDSRQNVQRQAAFALSDFGEKARPAVPVLIQCLNGTNTAFASLAARSLGKLKLEPHLATPALTAALQDPRPTVRNQAAFALAEFQGQGRPAVPILLSLLSDRSASTNTRTKAINALRKIAPEALTNAPPK